MKDILTEARISINDKVIYTDKTPKSLYEYYVNRYTIKDLATLVENLRMDFDTWDKTYNFYKSSTSIMNISSADVSVLYEDMFNNGFIYSFATKKVHCYNKDNAPYVDPDGMSLEQFLGVAKRDFEALLRTPYGKKYVTESAVLMEGFKEFFGFGTAIRVTINNTRLDSKGTRYAFDHHELAVLDSLINYHSGIITEDQYANMLDRQFVTLEEYTNRKLGSRDLLRRMPVKDSALQEEIPGTSLISVMVKYDIDHEEIYRDYYRAKSYQIAIEKIKNEIGKILNKFPDVKKAVVPPNDRQGLWGNNACCTYEFLIKNCLMSIYGPTADASRGVLVLDQSKYRNAHIAKAKNRLEKFANPDLHIKFLADLDRICAFMESCDKTKTWKFYYTFDCTEDEAKHDCTGLCFIKCYKSVAEKEPLYRPEVDRDFAKASAKHLKKVKGDMLNAYNASMYEAFTGESLDSINENIIKEKMTNVSIEAFNPSDKDFDLVIDKINKEEITEESFVNTMELVFERDLGRQVAHTVRSGVEKVSKAAKTVKRAYDSVIDPLMKKGRELIDDIQKASEDEDREIIITDSEFLKLRRFFTRTLAPAAGIYFAFGPAKMCVYALIRWYNNSDDEKTRQKIIRELETELKMTREKIEDAKGDNQRQAKYQLMRLESKIEDELARIKYGAK